MSRIKSIAIVGAGPSGLVAAKYLQAEKALDEIVIFEQRDRIGGIWNYTEDLRNEDLYTVPQTNPRGKNQDPIWRQTESDTKKEPSFLSPLYARLETNIPKQLMGFSDLEWPQGSNLFPKKETVLEYIIEYGRDVKDLIRFETQVLNIRPVDEKRMGGWHVQTRNLRTGKQQDNTFDAVIVANGHFIVPHIPDIPGIRAWNERYPGAITHSKYFRRPEDFEGKKVIVVGNSSSGMDISAQIAPLCQQPLLWSSRSASFLATTKTIDPQRREVPQITRFLPESRGVEFADGTREDDIDAVVFATGYFYSLPFLQDLKPELITDGTHVQHTYKHLFYAPRPTLSFLVLMQRVTPFPMAEVQSAVLARVYSGRLSFPSESEMRDWEEAEKMANGSGNTFHLLPFPKDANYLNHMSDWAMKAERRDGLENKGSGKIPPRWDEWKYWCRGNFPKIRGAYIAKGEERQNVKSIEELGFRSEDSLREDKMI
ncbi:flavin-containing monooxygenase [Sporormia fimetaria CBS 119925]|uniref:Flavin-containing monooxygenase n=1 Tax=Sporormia fimetaria CBS 119925 TaxID=1340428 RepID=A0A6A6UZL0_9PLEO|nr:flavin-containing monooxygenase [Sporormia fimetaria CBS 119925]